MTKSKTLQRGDKVKIIQSVNPLQLGETTWKLEAVDGLFAMISEVRADNKMPRAQEVEVKYLHKVLA